jgi:hypothetical protein
MIEAIKTVIKAAIVIFLASIGIGYHDAVSIVSKRKAQENESSRN